MDLAEGVLRALCLQALGQVGPLFLTDIVKFLTFGYFPFYVI